MKVLLNVSIARYSNDSFKVFESGEVVDLPAAEAERMITLGRASRVAPLESEETAPKVTATKTRTAQKRGV